MTVQARGAVGSGLARVRQCLAFSPPDARIQLRIAPMQQLRIDQPDAGTRLDRVLARRLSLSRRAVWQLLAEQRVCHGGQALRLRDKGRPMAAGEVLTVAPFVRPGQRRAMANPQLPLVVAGAGPGWLIADKPAGAPVHPLQPGERDTLLNAVIARHPAIHGVGEGGLRSGVVHRLDVDTSGLVLLALTESRWQQFREAFTAHRITKRYLALVHGRVAGDDRAAMHLAVTQHRPARVRVVEPDHPDSRRCSLAWQVRERVGDATLIDVDLHTGFLHQIRVMLAHLGHPILGDPVYSFPPPGHPPEPRPRRDASRLMLHAWALELDADVRARSHLPADFERVLAHWRSTRPALD